MTMTMRNPDHIIDFANPDLPVVELETSDPEVVDTPYRSRSWRHFVAPKKKRLQASGKRRSTSSDVNATTTNSVICSKGAFV